MRKLSRYLPPLFILALLFALLFQASAAKSAVFDGLLLCGKVLIPSLFPFFVAANLFLLLGYGDSLGRRTGRLLPKVFGISSGGAGALVLGLIGGYPIGAQTAADLYTQGLVTKKEAEQLTGFCSNAGPAFVFGAAGLGVFHSVATGLLLYLIHALSALLCGWLLRERKVGITCSKKPIKTAKPLSFSAAFPAAVGKGVKSLLNISGFVIFFSMLLQLLNNLAPIISLQQFLCGFSDAFSGLLSGILELSCGIVALQGCAPGQSFVAAATLLGWGGWCVHFQTLSVLSSAGLSGRCYLRGKALQGLISALLATPVAYLSFHNAMSPILPLLCSATLLFLVLIFSKKRGSNLQHSLI